MFLFNEIIQYVSYKLIYLNQNHLNWQTVVKITIVGSSSIIIDQSFLVKFSIIVFIFKNQFNQKYLNKIKTHTKTKAYKIL